MDHKVAKQYREGKPAEHDGRAAAVRVVALTDHELEQLTERAAQRGAALALATTKKLAAAPLTKREAMAELHCSLTTINRCIADGSLRSVRVGKEVLITRESIDALIGGV